MRNLLGSLCSCTVALFTLLSGCGWVDRNGRLPPRVVRDIRLAETDGQMLSRSFASMDRKGQQTVMADLEKQIFGVPFDETSYHGRFESLTRYCVLVDDCFKCLFHFALEKERLWQLRLHLLDRINVEIEKCNAEPVGGPYGKLVGGCGFVMFQSDYLSYVKKMRYERVRRSFEDNRLFCAYYHALPDDGKSQWLERLESLARRSVVIWDPKDHSTKLPQYVPEDTRKWCPTSPGEPREYMVDIGGGEKIRMREVRNGVFHSKTNDRNDVQRTTNNWMILNGRRLQ